MKKITTVFALLFLCINLSAQEVGDMAQQYQEAMNYLLSGLDEDKVTTGILMERAIPLTTIENFNSTDTCWNSTASDWISSYMQIYYGHLISETFNLDTNLLNEFPLSETINNEIPFGMILYDYNTISEDAYINGYIKFDTINSVLSDISGPQINPYNTNTCFVASPLIKSVGKGSYNFNIMNDLFFSNKIDDFDSLSIDFGDGFGFQRVYLGSSFFVNYSEVGTKEIFVVAKKGDNTYYAKSILYVFEPISSKGEISPDFGPEDFEAELTGITGEYAVWYACNNDNKEIRKPYIIVSGYDPSNKNRLEGDDEYKVNLYSVANKDGYLERLREDGFDIIIYRSKESTKSVINNAYNLVSFIEDINSRKTSDNELIIVGASQGGLLTRYALTYMEKYGIDHQTKLFISMDSPQLGANVPLGFQHMFHTLAGLLNDMFPIWNNAEELLNTNMLDSDAAQQMLLYHYKKTNNLKAGPSDKRVEFLEDLESIGNFPQNCRTIGISQGSGNGKIEDFGSGELVLEKDAAYMGGGLGAFPNMRLEFKVKSVPNESLSKIFYVKVSWQVCVRYWYLGWHSKCYNPPEFPDAIVIVSVDNTKPYDNAPGSTQGFHNLKSLKSDESFVLGIGMDDIISFLEDAGYFYHDDEYDCFMPTFSSLALNTDNPHINAKEFLRIYDNVLELNDNTFFNFNGESVSLFDVLYVENDNLSHIYDSKTLEGNFSEQMLSFMSNEASPDDLFLENFEVDNGQSIMYEARDSITIGENIDDIDENNGEVIVKDGGKLTLNANNSITLKPGFTALSGSIVEIKPDASWYCDEKSIEIPIIQTENFLAQPANEKKESDVLYDLVKEFSQAIIIYPNPAKDNIYISSDKEINEIKIHDMEGRIILNESFKKKTVLNISQFESGTYIIEISQIGGEKVVKRIIKL